MAKNTATTTTINENNNSYNNNNKAQQNRVEHHQQNEIHSSVKPSPCALVCVCAVHIYNNQIVKIFR